MQPRSQGGPWHEDNGAFLCSHHHRAKTEARLRYRRAWLDDDQVAWLAAAGWVVWAADGSVSGRGYRHFEPEPSGQSSS